jgi:Protein of unknown function (DUF2586)
MASEVRYIIADGGLGITPEGEDHVSALVFGMAAPSGFGTKKVKEYNDLTQAVADGITKGDLVYAEVYYQLSEFWRMNAGATLFIAFQLSNMATELFAASAGRIKQVGFMTSDLANGISAAQTAANTLMSTYFAPCEFMVAYMPTGSSFDITTLPDLHTMNSKNVAVLIGGSNTGEGAAIAAGLGRLYTPALGATLGAVSAAQVHMNIGWVERFNFMTATENAEVRLLDGVTDSTDATFTAVITSLGQKGYLFLRKRVGIAGSYIQSDYTATALTSDFSSIRNNRVMGKAIRGTRTQLLPKLNSPLYVDGKTGKLAANTIEEFKAATERPLMEMRRLGELSDYGVLINPDQNVLATPQLNIKIRLVPVGSAQGIVVTLQYALTANFQ